MADDATVARIRAYLEQHRYTYERDVLRQKLIDDGAPPQAVDLAIAQVYGFDVQGTSTPAATSNVLTIVLLGFGVFLLNYAASFLTLAASNGSEYALIVPAVLALGELVAAIVLWRRRPPIARGLAWGLAGSLIPLVLLALLFGICIALLGGF